MDPLISGPDHPRWTDPQFLALAQHKQEAAMPRYMTDIPRDQWTLAEKIAWDAYHHGILDPKGNWWDWIAPVIQASLDRHGPPTPVTIPDGYMLVPIVLPPGIVTQATPAVELRDKPGNMVERCWRLLLSALQAKGY